MVHRLRKRMDFLFPGNKKLVKQTKKNKLTRILFDLHSMTRICKNNRSGDEMYARERKEIRTNSRIRNQYSGDGFETLYQSLILFVFRFCLIVKRSKWGDLRLVLENGRGQVCWVGGIHAQRSQTLVVPFIFWTHTCYAQKRKCRDYILAFVAFAKLWISRLVIHR